MSDLGRCAFAGRCAAGMRTYVAHRARSPESGLSKLAGDAAAGVAVTRQARRPRQRERELDALSIHPVFADAADGFLDRVVSLEKRAIVLPPQETRQAHLARLRSRALAEGASIRVALQAAAAWSAVVLAGAQAGCSNRDEVRRLAAKNGYKYCYPD